MIINLTNYISISMKLHILTYILLFVVCTSFLLSAQPLPKSSQPSSLTIKNKGIPFIKNYTPDDYGAQNQNWWMAQDKRGVLYVANSEGLLEFDGVRWRILRVLNKSTVRSLALGIDGVIYVGCEGFVGYVAVDSIGKTYLASLMDRVPEDIRGFKDVWETVPTNEGVLLQTKEALFIARNRKIQKVIRPETAFTFYVTEIDGKAYIYQKNKGTFRVEKGNLIPEPSFGKMRVNWALPLGNGKLLFCNLAAQLKVYDGKTLQPFAPELQKILKNKGVYYTTHIGGQYLIFGTKNGGIIITDTKGEIIQHLHKGNGLLDNQLHYLHVDQNQNLWAGLSRGIAFIELNSPFTLWNESAGLDGTMQNTFIHQNRLLTGTSKGIYHKPWKAYENPMENQHRFKIIKETKDHQIWEIKAFKGKLLASINPTILRLKKNPDASGKQFQTTTLKNLEGRGSVWNITALRSQTNLLVAARKSGLYLLEWKNDQWKVKHKIKGFSKDSRYILEGKQNHFWTSNNIEGIYKLKLTPTLDSVVQVTSYGKAQGLPSNAFNKIIRLNENMVCLTENGIYLYDAAKDGFVREKKLNTLIGEKKRIWVLKTDATQNIWYAARKIKNGIKDKYVEVGILQKQADGSYKKIVTPFRKLRSSVGNDDNGQFNLIDAQNVLITAKEGIIHYNPAQLQPKNSFQVLLREIALTGAKDSVIFGGAFAGEKGEILARPPSGYKFPVFSHQHNSIRFSVGSTHYTDNDQNEFRYYLEGTDKAWSSWTKQTFKEYPNLREGRYKLHIQTRNLYLQTSPELAYRFKIRPPWYRSVLAYVTYIVLGLLTILATISMYTRRLRRQKEKLEETVKERTEEVMLKNAELTSQKEEITVQVGSLLEANVAITQQKEEISAQAEELRAVNNDLVDKSNQIEMAYKNVKLLSEIGQSITSKLSITQIVETVYQNIQGLMDVSEFGIGLHDPVAQTLTYEDYIHHDQRMPTVTISVQDKNRFTALSVIEQKEIVVGNVYQEYSQYIQSLDSYEEGELLNSFICIPLLVADQVIGLISVQSALKYAYQPYHLNLLRNLAVYITIALVNTESYNKIQAQKSKIEHQNKAINSSIRYAQTIQNAILPGKRSFETLFAEHFIIYEPKDIVSGDFYWLSEVGEYTFVASVDCTGHGVPGAFMSMVGSRLLNEVVNERQILDPAEVIAQIQTGIWEGLRQEESENRDGMDMGICRIKYLADSDGVEVVYSNAKRPLFYTHQQKLVKLRRDRVMIGGMAYKSDPKPPVNHTLLLKKGDILYLTSDGFVDTPNPDRKSFGEKRLLEVIEEIRSLPLEEQKQHLLQVKANYQGTSKQRDDILVMG